MNNRVHRRKSKQGLVLASLLGLVAVAVIGAWLLTHEGGAAQNSKPVKPLVETRR